jgi:hypothetical protein
LKLFIAEIDAKLLKAGKYMKITGLLLNLHYREKKIQVEVFWVVVQGEDGGNKFFQNAGTLLQHYMISKPRRPQLESSPPQTPQILH